MGYTSSYDDEPKYYIKIAITLLGIAFTIGVFALLLWTASYEHNNKVNIVRQAARHDVKTGQNTIPEISIDYLPYYYDEYEKVSKKDK